MKLPFSIGLMTAALALASCSGEAFDGSDEAASRGPEILISSALSRATDYGFEENDRVGLFVVNRDGSEPGTLLESGNHVDNMGHTYSGIWTPDEPIYWKDDVTHADFYLYYPYQSGVSVSAMPFEVKADQSTEEAFKASDLMLGTALDVAPTASAISIPVSHLFSRMNIKVEPGNGFTATTLAAAEVSVKVNGLKCGSTVNLATGEVTPAGTPVSVTPLFKDGFYKALIVPQEVEQGNLITVNVNGRDFNLKKAFTFVGGTSYSFTVVVSKTSSGVNVEISPWVSDDVDYGGTAE